MGAQLFNLVKDLFDPESTYVISDFLNQDDTEILLSQNWKLLKLEQILSQENDCVLGFLLWWPTILDEKIINKFKTGIVNFHPSYLPFGQGKDPYFWSIVNDEPFGISCHFIDKKIDSRSLIKQKKIAKDWVSKIIQSDYALEKIVNLSVNYRKDTLNRSYRDTFLCL